MGGMESALKKAAEFAEISDYSIEIFPTDTDPLMQFIERFSGDTVETWLGPKTLARLHMVEQWSPLLSMQKPGVYTRLMTSPDIR
jgi:hypothetical protein